MIYHLEGQGIGSETIKCMHFLNYCHKSICPIPKQPTDESVITLEMTGTETDRIIEMAWEDKTPFEAIQAQFGLSEAEVIVCMRRELKPSSFRNWRKRVNSGTSRKHLHKRNSAINRFKSSRQRDISNNKISKR